MSGESKRLPGDIKLEFACAVICLLAALLFHFSGSPNVAMGLLGVAGGAALGGFLGLAQHFDFFGAPKQ